MRNVAIVGGGIVGMTLAYYLSKEKRIQVSLFDDGNQASKAAVGIVCPWLNQRRNTFWYELVRDGAEFYDRLIKDLNDESFYQKTGALYINPKMESKIYELAKKRRIESYKLGQVSKVSKAMYPELSPQGFLWETGIFVSGAARVDGQLLLQVLLDASLKQGLNYQNKKVRIFENQGKYQIEDQLFDQIVLAPGAYLNEAMKFKKDYHVDLWVQKGQLILFERKDKQDYPVIMPKGEIDFLFGEKGQLVVGASHENDIKSQNVDWDVLYKLKEAAEAYYPKLQDEEIKGYRVGFRAHNSSYTPFYGNLKEDPNIFVAGALGSSGLTSGPIIAYRLAKALADPDLDFSKEFNADDYVYKKKKPQ